MVSNSFVTRTALYRIGERATAMAASLEHSGPLLPRRRRVASASVMRPANANHSSLVEPEGRAAEHAHPPRAPAAPSSPSPPALALPRSSVLAGARRSRPPAPGDPSSPPRSVFPPPPPRESRRRSRSLPLRLGYRAIAARISDVHERGGAEAVAELGEVKAVRRHLRSRANSRDPVRDRLAAPGLHRRGRRADAADAPVLRPGSRCWIPQEQASHVPGLRPSPSPTPDRIRGFRGPNRRFPWRRRPGSWERWGASRCR